MKGVWKVMYWSLVLLSYIVAAASSSWEAE